MPKSIPTVGQSNWGQPLNDHLSKLNNPTNGGVNFSSTNPDTTGWGANETGYTFVNTTENTLKSWNGSSWSALLTSGGGDVAEVKWFAMETLPTDFLQCDGAAVSRTTYAALYSKIGTTYGAGDGSTTFNLPDLRGEFIRGFDDGRGVDTGRVLGSSQGDAFQGHGHTIYGTRLEGWNSSHVNIAFSDKVTDIGGAGGKANNIETDGTNGTPRTASETRPRNVAMMPAIRWRVTNSAGGSFAPIGTVNAYFGGTAPEGWLLCNGSAISRTTYANLFSVIGTTSGSGDGSTTFNLPDLRGEFIRGFDDGRGVDTGRVLGSSQGDLTKIPDGVMLRVGYFNNSDGHYDLSGSSSTASVNDLSQAPWGNSSSVYYETRPRNVAANYIIKY